MSEIPEDIREAAAKAIERKGAPRGQLATRVAEAILAERMLHYDARWANKAVNDVMAEFAGALWDIRDERTRQVDDEGWTPEHDDKHAFSELAEAAACYAISGAGFGYGEKIEGLWPWDRSWFKPTDPRRDLVKAAALIVAEIERLDRRAIHERDNPRLGNFDIEEASLSDEEV